MQLQNVCAESIQSSCILISCRNIFYIVYSYINGILQESSKHDNTTTCMSVTSNQSLTIVSTTESELLLTLSHQKSAGMYDLIQIT